MFAGINMFWARLRLILGPVYMEKSCPGQEGHPPSRVNFTERLYEKKLTPLPKPRANFPITAELAHALIVSP